MSDMRQRNSNTGMDEGQDKFYHHLGPILQCLNHRLIYFIKIYKNLNYVLSKLGEDCNSVAKYPTCPASARPWDQFPAPHNNISTLANQNQLFASLLKENCHQQSDSATDAMCNNTDQLAK